MKHIVVDFSALDDMCGFGEIARNYCPRLAKMHFDDMRFIFILPEGHKGEFGDHIDYVAKEHLKAEIKQFKEVDLWHATDQQFRYRRKSKGTLQLLTVHDLNYLREKHGIHLLKHKIRTHWIINHSDYVTVISAYVRDDIRKNIPSVKKEMQVIYNGIADDENGAQQRPSFVSKDDERFFFTIGQVRPKKNFHTLVPMMKSFPNHRLFICGDDHWDYSDEIRNMIDEADKDRILVTGKISNEEKRWLYAHCEAFLFPSTLEGFGIPVLEAMRYGARVVSSRCTCLPEVCGSHAAYWDCFDPKHMAQVVKSAISGWDTKGRLALMAADYSKSFNYDRYTKEYVALYRKLLGLPTLD